MPITSPFSARSTAKEVVSGHNLTGKTALITGANSGIGLETARALLSAHAEVIIAIRNITKGESAVQELRGEIPDAQVHVLQLDLGSLSAIRQAAEQFRARWTKLDLLINNAGIMATPLGYTPDGFEQQFGTNYLGHFLLTLLLLPTLRAAPQARIVSLTSSAHQRSDVHFNDIQYRHRPYDKWEAYGQSKTAAALFAVALTHHIGNQNITANAVHPGGIRTGLQQNLTQDEMHALGWYDDAGNLNPRFKTPEQGAATSVWAAVGHELEGVGGLYLEDCHESTPLAPGSPAGSSGYMPYALNPEHAEQLWTLSHDLVGLKN
ncbi:MAG TPA: oxidoreductase [Ktedonobacteraceae bacterium]|nr:oxidoreductase [Ktedonobacteraceae bacterium]